MHITVTTTYKIYPTLVCQDELQLLGDHHIGF